MLRDYVELLHDSESVVEAFMAALEAILISIVGRVGVWLTPLPSAILVSRSAERVFALGDSLAWVMAGVIELVGLVTSNLWLNAKEWNRNKNKSDPEANEELALTLMLGYFVTTALLLLAFEVPVIVATGSITGLTALLFPALSAVGIITLNERMLQHKRAAEKAVNKVQRRHKSGTKAEYSGAEMPAQWGGTSGKTRDRAKAILAERPGISGAELGRQLGRSERLGRRLKAELLTSENGNG
jgi:hypothetical protein